MTTFSTQIFSCIHCNQRMIIYELTSYHIYSSQLYSDGYCDNNPPTPSTKSVVFCTSCEKEMWKDDLVYEEPDYDIHEDLPVCKDVYDLPLSREENYLFNIAQYYSELIRKGFADTTKREILLRFEIWQLLNNNRRHRSLSLLVLLFTGRFHLLKRRFKDRNSTRKNNRQIMSLFNENLIKLIEIFVPENDDDKLMKAEMCRELGRFHTAKKILKSLKNLKNTKAYKKILKETQWRRTRVVKLN